MKRSQQGVAILTVLLMVALATITVVSMSSRQRLDIRRAANQQSLQQSRALALGGEKFAAATLMRDKLDPLTGKTDSLDDDWAQSLPPLPVDQSTIKGCVFDLQGRFNLNNLLTGEGRIDQDQFAQLQRLLTVLNIDPAKAAAIADWMDSDLEPLGEDGAEDQHYSALEPPYRPANRKLVSISELKMVKGFSPADEDEKADYDLLLPHVTALPERTRINVNTATPAVIASIGEMFQDKADEVSRWTDETWENYPECEDIFDLAALANKVQEDAVESAAEDKEPFASENEFFTAAGVSGNQDILQALGDKLSVQSDYFQIRVDVATGEVLLTQFSLVRRDNNGANKIIQRSRSVF
ncbi:MAG: type II secretion system minor pseudopilin GspK [Gammaproteobacteria bacterium]|nr:type II secretion system minor pseudopilin GspK [Gammaproteobacteria bacterium]